MQTNRTKEEIYVETIKYFRANANRWDMEYHSHSGGGSNMVSIKGGPNPDVPWNLRLFFDWDKPNTHILDIQGSEDIVFQGDYLDEGAYEFFLLHAHRQQLEKQLAAKIEEIAAYEDEETNNAVHLTGVLDQLLHPKLENVIRKAVDPDKPVSK